MTWEPPLIAICGRPNVGKSTLFNRLVGGRPALVHNSPHLTRDRRYGEFDYDGRPLRVVDTGGLDPEAAKEVIGAGVHRQAKEALAEADAAILVVDARSGSMPLDLEVASMLRKLSIPIFVAANKVDGPNQDPLTADLYSIGLGDIYAISASHGRGVENLIDAVIDSIPEDRKTPPPAVTVEASEDEERPESTGLRVAFIGKPNAGKSSLLNRLVGSERALVHDQPGTTTDPVDCEIEIGDQRFTLVDTAGIRRRAKIGKGHGTSVLDADQEKIAVSLALGQIRRADVVVLLIDASIGPSEQDAKLVNMVLDAGRALVVGLNKADLILNSAKLKELREKTSDDLRFAKFASVVIMSTVRGDGVGNLLAAIGRASRGHGKRVGTAELNKFFAEVLETHPPPIHRGRSVTIRYLTQGGTRPPVFLLWANRKSGISVSYKRYIVNQLRARYSFEGTPVRLVIKAKNETGRKSKARKR